MHSQMAFRLRVINDSIGVDFNIATLLDDLTPKAPQYHGKWQKHIAIIAPVVYARGCETNFSHSDWLKLVIKHYNK